MIATIDRTLSRVPMYRLMSIALGVILVAAIISSLAGALFYSPLSLILSAVVAVLSTALTSRLFALIFRSRVHGESSIITGLIIFFLMLPSVEVGGLLVIALVGFFAGASKYVLAWRGRHLFNPAAIGAFIVSLTGLGAAGWWVATLPLLPFVVLGGAAILWRTRTLIVPLVFIGTTYLLVITPLLSFGADAFATAIVSYPILFLGMFMLTEPLTLPPRRWQQVVVALVVAVLFALPLYLGSYLSTSLSFGNFYLSQEFALVIGNLVAAAIALPAGARLRLIGSREVGPGSLEFAFESDRPLRRRAGQYAELHVPHRRADARGERRHLTVVSAPESSGRDITVAVRMPERRSSFKSALAELKQGDDVRLTWLGGDFLLPKDEKTPVLLVAGGIGITPFVGQFAEAAAGGRDVTLVYRASSSDDLLYRDELAAARAPVVVVTRDEPTDLPFGWSWQPDLAAAFASLASVGSRTALLSGTPTFVARATGALRAAGVKRIHTDRFSGY
ncbi:FAD-dependent oxidoreductase [Naasia lichenicola]|uniref:Oxidoreductase n=1 Tax=Naasia lichenicola TaxID=2565933 RepID=A0A4S4FEN6_9MICO|nr:oxidoreductase [Naasia lichenicola]THG28561.1 oxidoreductase [Naasia lichenicola]